MLTRRLVIRLLLSAVVVAGIVISLLLKDFWWIFGSLAVFGVAAMVFQQSLKPRTVDVAEAIEGLVRSVTRHWETELYVRQGYSSGLDIAFQSADPALSDHWSNISDQRQRPDLRGKVDQLADSYLAMPSRRLVILGGPGAGKTSAAVRLTLDLLRQRQTGDPVAVIVNAGSWDPATTTFPDWLAREAEIAYPWLAANERHGGTVAWQLIVQRLLIPVVDGFDELPNPRRVAALRSLDLWQGALVLLCRSAEYARLVDDFGVVPRAAVVELEPLSLSSVVDYLTALLPTPPPTRFGPFIETLQSVEPGPIGVVLRSPIMVQALKLSYIDNFDHPGELLDRDRFPTRELIEDHLFETMVSSLLTQRPRFGLERRYDEARAQRWLAFLVEDIPRALGFRIDFHWWELGLRTPRWVLAGAGALVVAVGVTVVASFVDLFLGIVAGLVSGLVAYPVAQLIIRWGHPEISGPANVTLPMAVQAVMTAMMGAAPMALVAMQAAGWRGGVFTGIVFFLALAANAWLSNGLRSPYTDPVTTLLASLSFALARCAALGVTVSGLLGFLAYRFFGDFAHAALAAGMGGVITLLWLVVGSAWGRFFVAQVWLGLRGVVPWRLLTFLETMRRLGLIAAVGPAYRFKYPELRYVLARSAGRGDG